MKPYAENRKAHFNYEILDEYEAGIVLSGPEVKSIRAGQISLKESFATVKGNEMWLTNAHISPYEPATDQNTEPTRPRKLLLSKSEIVKIIGKLSTDGFSMIPMKVYDKHGKIKVLLGLGKGKKKYDKRDTLKNRDIARDVKRELKERVR